MKFLKLFGTGLLAIVSIGLLFFFLSCDQISERRTPLIILAAISLIWFSRKQSLATIALIIPLGPILDTAFLTTGRGIYATEVALLSAVTIWLINKTRKGQTPPRPTLPVLLLCIYSLLGVIALAFGHNSLFNNLRMLRQLFLAAMIALLVQDLISKEQLQNQQQKRWAAATLLGLSVLALGGIVEFLLKNTEPGSFYRGSVSLAVHIAFFSPLGLSIWLSSWSRFWRWAGAAAWILSIFCLPLTASRGAIGSVLITSVGVFLLASLRSSKPKWSIILVIFSIGIAGSVLLTHPQLAGDNFAYKVNASLKGDFFSTRTNEWEHAINALKTSPLIGEGPESSSNSIPLETAQRNGIPAAIFLFAAILAAMYSLIKRARHQDFSTATIWWGLSLGILGFLLVGLAETGLGARTTPLLAIVIALACSNN